MGLMTGRALCICFCGQMILLSSLSFQETSISALSTERIGHIISDPRQKE